MSLFFLTFLFLFLFLVRRWLHDDVVVGAGLLLAAHAAPLEQGEAVGLVAQDGANGGLGVDAVAHNAQAEVGFDAAGAAAADVHDKDHDQEDGGADEAGFDVAGPGGDAGGEGGKDEDHVEGIAQVGTEADQGEGADDADAAGQAVADGQHDHGADDAADDEGLHEVRRLLLAAAGPCVERGDGLAHEVGAQNREDDLPQWRGAGVDDVEEFTHGSLQLGSTTP